MRSISPGAEHWIGQIFLEHYVPRWEDLAGSPAGWFAKASPIPAGSHPDLSRAPDPARPAADA
jgi:hypothetical protein